MSSGLVVYLVCVGIIGFGVLVRTWLWLRSSHLNRRRRLVTRKKIDPVNTQSPLGDPAKLATQRGLESIQRQFSVHQLLLIPLIVLLTGMAAAIPFLGSIPATIVSTLAAALTVILGVAARPFIENAIAGLTVAFSRLVNIGDTVELDGHYGTIEDITATHTTIKIWDWRRYVVPNTRMLGANLINYSLNDNFIWVRVQFNVAYGADIDQVRDLALAAPLVSTHYRDYENPRFWVMSLDREYITCWVVAWADNPPEAWLLGHDARTEIIRQLTKRGIPTHAHRVVLGGKPPE